MPCHLICAVMGTNSGANHFFQYLNKTAPLLLHCNRRGYLEFFLPPYAAVRYNPTVELHETSTFEGRSTDHRSFLTLLLNLHFTTSQAVCGHLAWVALQLQSACLGIEGFWIHILPGHGLFPLLYLSISLSLRSVSFNRSFEELVGCNTTDFPVKR